MSPSYEYFEVEADVGVIGRGVTAAEAFVQTALGVFALIVEPDSVEVRDEPGGARPRREPGDASRGWLNECLYVHEVEGFVAPGEVAPRSSTPFPGRAASPSGSTAFLHGEEMDAGPTSTRSSIVKAATLHQVAVAPVTMGMRRGCPRCVMCTKMRRA